MVLGLVPNGEGTQTWLSNDGGPRLNAAAGTCDIEKQSKGRSLVGEVVKIESEVKMFFVAAEPEFFCEPFGTVHGSLF